MASKKKMSQPEVKMFKVEELLKHVHEKNPRQHPQYAIDKLVRSIEEFGWTNPVLLDADGRVIAGHARLKAAVKAGVEEVPAIMLPLKGAKADAYLIADNRLQQDTVWDSTLLTDVLSQLKTDGFDLTLTGFEQIEISKILAPPEHDAIVDEGEQENEEPAATQHTCPQCGYQW